MPNEVDERTSAVVATELKECFEKFEKDATAFIEKGNVAAGTRSRVTSSAMDKLFREYRKISMDN